MKNFKCIGVSEGYGIGKAFILEKEYKLNEKSNETIEFEIKKYNDALSKSIADLRESIEKSATSAEILDAHIMLLEDNEFKNAITYLSKAKKITSKRHLINEVSDLLVTAYSKLGDFKTALELSTQLSKAKDSVNSLKESEEIARITAQFESEKQEKEILQLKQENQEKDQALPDRR